jgi:nucleoside-diphosphate-sugar epimerase
MSSKTNIFFTGATGYIGGSVLSRLLKHPKADTFKITALVRSEEKAAKLRKLGVHALVGAFSDLDRLQTLASEADVVFSIADADNLKAAKAVLAGLKKRHDTQGTVPVLIHTSGTGVLTDDAKGMFAYDTIYDDSDADQMETLWPPQIHRDVDLANVNADKEGYVKTYIILPSTIYGIATGHLVDEGIQNTRSIQIPLLIEASIDRGRAGMVGLGKNRWPNVNIEEIADLYIILYDSICSDPSTGHGRNGYYFGENGEHCMYEVGKAVEEALVAFKRGAHTEPSTFTEEELEQYFGGGWLGSNSRCRATHSRSIGWKPTKTTKDLLESIKPEVETSLAQKPEDDDYEEPEE